MACCVSKATCCIVQTSSPLQLPAEFAKRSASWVERLKSMLPQLSQLPSTKEEVEAILFPAESTLRIPVAPAFYARQNVHEAAKFLEPADNSSLVIALTFLLQEHLAAASSEQDPTKTAGLFFSTVFSHLARHHLHDIHPQLLFNCTDPPCYTSSRGVLKGVRPDTILIMNECTS